MDVERMDAKVKTEQQPGLHGKLFNDRKSNFQKYREMMVGEQSLVAFLRFELTILLFSQIPGALGLVLRRILFRPLFKGVGKNVVFGRNLTIRQPQKIIIGSNVIIDDDCLIDAKGETNEGIKIGDFVTIGRFSSLVCKDSDIEISDHVNIGSSVKIVAGNQGKIKIGKSIDIGSGCHFSGGSYDYSNPEVLPSSARTETLGITLEDMCWIGTGAILLDGVTIGTKSIIGAGAVVTSDIHPYCVAVGVPAKVVRERKNELSKK